MPASLVIRKMQIRTAIRYHFVITSMAIIKNLEKEQVLVRNPYALFVGT